MPLPDIHIDPQRIRELVAQRLIDQLAAVLELVPPHEHTPAGDSEPIWAQMHEPVVIDRPRQQGAGEPDELTMVLSISVGVSAAQSRSDPTTLERTLAFIARALRGWAGRHAATSHHAAIDRVDLTPDTQPDPQTPMRSGAAVVTLTAHRVTGSAIAGE